VILKSFLVTCDNTVVKDYLYFMIAQQYFLHL